MSDTSRTDAACYKAGTRITVNNDVSTVSASFARQLERELAQAQRKQRQAEDQVASCKWIVKQWKAALAQAKERIMELESQANFAADNATKLVDKCAAGEAVAEALRASLKPGLYAVKARTALTQWEKLNKNENKTNPNP